ncbi:unnamed protein product, partial [Laminaria digitata]
MRANEPTRVECSLVHAQNALMRQSEADAEGLVHGHGWGVADYRDGLPLIEKQTWAAFHGEHFRRTAARVYAHTVIAHVRRATVGGTSIENTHPFHHGRWIFAHNGTVPNFPAVRDRMIGHIDPLLRNDIEGTTDSEHVFYYLISLQMRHPDYRLRDIIGHGLRRITSWSNEVDPAAAIGLNIVLTNGEQLVGSRLGRTLWHLVREDIVTCGICGQKHVHHDVGHDYRVIEIASEPITDENWRPFSDGVVYSVDEDFHFEVEAL